MILKGRGVSKGVNEGEVVKVEDRVSFLGDVDPETGKVFNDKNIEDKVFVFPGGRGSTVGSYVIYQLKKNGYAPKAMINQQSETIVAAGAIISEIPLVDDIQIDLLKDGDIVKVNGDTGEIDLIGLEETLVTTAFLKKDGKILLVKRSEEVGTFHERWSAISGYLELKDPLDNALIEVEEETGLTVKLLSKGKTVLARGEGNIWKVYPFLFEAQGEVQLNWENKEYKWVEPGEMKKLETVPKLWEAYRSVR